MGQRYYVGTATEISTISQSGGTYASADATFSTNWKSSNAISEIVQNPQEWFAIDGYLTGPSSTDFYSAGTWLPVSEFDYVSIQLAATISTAAQFSARIYGRAKLYGSTPDVTVLTASGVNRYPPAIPVATIAGGEGSAFILTSETSATTLETSRRLSQAYDIYDVRGLDWVFPTVGCSVSDATSVRTTLKVTGVRRI